MLQALVLGAVTMVAAGSTQDAGQKLWTRMKRAAATPQKLFPHSPTHEEIRGKVKDVVETNFPDSVWQKAMEVSGLDMQQMAEFGKDFMDIIEEALEFRLLGDASHSEDLIAAMDSNPEDIPTRRLAIKQTMSSLRNLHEGVHYTSSQRRIDPVSVIFIGVALTAAGASAGVFGGLSIWG